MYYVSKFFDRIPPHGERGSVRQSIKWLKILKWTKVTLGKFENKKDCHEKGDYRCYGQQFSSHRSKTD